MKKILSLLALVLMSCMGAWAQITYSTAGNPMTYEECVALSGTGKHFGLMAVSDNEATYKKWFGFSAATSRVDKLTTAQLFTLTGETNNYTLTRYSTNTAAVSGVKMVNRAGGDHASEYTAAMQISFDNASNQHFNANSYNYAPGTGGWSAYVAYGPFYVARVEYQLEGTTVATVDLIVKEGENTITTAPAEYKLKGTPSINVTADGTYQVPVVKDETPRYDVTYYIQNMDGVDVPVVVNNVEGGSTAVVPTVSGYFTGAITESDHVVSENNKTFHVTGTWTFPFDKAKYYTMKATNSNKYVCDGTHAWYNNSVKPADNNDVWQLALVEGTLDLFTVKNCGYNKYAVLSGSGRNACTFADEPTEWTEGTGATSYFRVVKQNGGFNLQHPGDAETNVGSHVDDMLGSWKNANSATNGASINVIEETTLVTPSEKIDVTYNFFYNSKKIGEKTIKESVGAAPTVELPSYVSTTDLPTEIAAGVTSYNVNTTYTTLPFTIDGYTTMTVRGHNIHADLAGGNAVKSDDVARVYANQKYFDWKIGGDWFNGFTFQSKASDKYLSYGTNASPADNKAAVLVETPEVGSYLDLKSKDKKWFLCIHGTTNDSYINYRGANLGTWANSAAYGEVGSVIDFAEAEVIPFDLSADKAAAIASVEALAGIPALFTTTNIDAAKTAINAVTCTTNDEADINAALAALETAKENLLKTAEGKKFAVKTTQGNHNYLYANTDHLDATNAEKTAAAVYDLVYDKDGKFFLHGLKNNVYVCKNTAVNSPANVATVTSNAGSVYVGKLADSNENTVYFAYELTGNNAIHYNSNYTGHNCVWTYNAGASQWTIEPITDEEWETLNAIIDTTPLEQAIAKAKNYNSHIGNGLNQYSWIIEGVNFNDEWTDVLDYYESLIEEITSDEEVQEMVTNVNDMMNQLQINQPADGSFVRVRSVKSGMGYVNAEASTAHTNALKLGAKGASSIYYYKDGKLLAYNCGQYLAKNSDGGGFLSLGEVGNEGCSIAFNKTDAKIGAYAVVFNGNRYLYAGDNATNVDAGSSAGNDAYTFWLEPVGELPVSISAAKYATLYAPVALTIPANVTAYTLTVEGDYLKATAVETTIPANTGVVLAAEEAGTYNFAITTSEAFEGQNVLTGTVPTIAKIANALVLGMKDDQIGFYGVKDEVANLAGFKAYYVPTAGESNLRIVFDNDTLTSIITAAQENGGQAIYDLQGRRVVKTQNGLNIVNGKKVIK